MDDIPILGRGEDSKLRKHFLAQYGAPAFVRRARQVQDALEQLIDRCRQQRDEWLQPVRTRLGMLQDLAGDWSSLRPCLRDEDQLALVRHLHATVGPQTRLRLARTDSTRKLRRALRELQESIERFNRRWRLFLPSVNLTRLNELRADYNRYYVLEKECAVRSPVLARQGFTRLGPLTSDDLLVMLPLLPLPQLGG